MTKMIFMELMKETKRTVVYEQKTEQGAAVEPIDEVITTIYIQKIALKAPYPRRLRVSIESVEDL